MSSIKRYVFLDEGGNFDFSPKGTRYLTITAVVTKRPFLWDAPLLDLKYDLLEQDREDEYFHATEDRQEVRNKVFQVLSGDLRSFEIHSVIVEKSKAHPNIRDVETIYPRMLNWLMQYIFYGANLRGDAEAIVITDIIPVNKKRDAVEKSIHQSLNSTGKLKHSIFHHASKSCLGLQVVDYCNWAIFRKWNNGDTRSYELIKDSIKSEFDIFKSGKRSYY
jgi:hypothetical protein